MNPSDHAVALMEVTARVGYLVQYTAKIDTELGRKRVKQERRERYLNVNNINVGKKQAAHWECGN